MKNKKVELSEIDEKTDPTKKNTKFERDIEKNYEIYNRAEQEYQNNRSKNLIKLFFK